MQILFCFPHIRRAAGLYCRAMARQSHRFPLTGVNWNSDITLGDRVPCYYPGCARTFPNHTDLTDHIFTDHGTPACRVDALPCVLFLLVVLLTVGGDQ